MANRCWLGPEARESLCGLQYDNPSATSSIYRKIVNDHRIFCCVRPTNLSLSAMHNRSPAFSMYWLTLPLSIHGQTIEVYGPKLETTPHNSRMCGWESFFQIWSSRLRRCTRTPSERQHQSLREVKPTSTSFAFNAGSLVVFRRTLTATYRNDQDGKMSEEECGYLEPP